MQNKFARIYLAFAAGAIAGFIQTAVIWICGQVGVFTVLQLPLEFPLNPLWFYQRVAWGGLWGLLFLIPLMSGKAQWKRGLVLGLIPALASLIFFLPFKNDQGFFGLNLGVMMPVVVIVFGLLWGAIAGELLARAEERQPAGD